MPLITLNNASLAYGLTPLLDHVDFQLDAGERVGLIGRNGTGKSTLLKVLASVSKLDREEVDSIAAAIRERTGLKTETSYETV